MYDELSVRVGGELDKGRRGGIALIFIAIGSNLPTPRYGEPRTGCGAALAALARAGAAVVRASPWYRTAPVPASDQPWFVNAVVEVRTAMAPAALLALMHGIERDFGRIRTVANAARVLDLDLLAYDDRVADGRDGGPILPHPRLHNRAFVLVPLVDLAPDWRHPVLKKTAAELLKELGPTDAVVPMPPGSGMFGTDWREVHP